MRKTFDYKSLAKKFVAYWRQQGKKVTMTERSWTYKGQSRIRYEVIVEM